MSSFYYYLEWVGEREVRLQDVVILLFMEIDLYNLAEMFEICLRVCVVQWNQAGLRITRL